MGRLDRAKEGSAVSSRLVAEVPLDRNRAAMVEHGGPRSHVARLVKAAETGLPTMLGDHDLFCYEQFRPTAGGRGISVRYTLITLLGLLRRAACGLPSPVPISRIQEALTSRRGEMGVGDAGLALWAQVRHDPERAAVDLAVLKERTASQTHDDLVGLEVAWWVIAAAEAQAAGLPAEDELKTAVAVFTARRSRRSPLFRHTGSGWRSAFPNFATEIYSLLALTHLARHGHFAAAEAWAIELADVLVELQRDDGGWPWLYHADRAAVVEPYEIYSVHQDAMAPMGLFAVAEMTGRLDYARAALDGVPWCFGQNDLGLCLVDEEHGFIDRSIRRKGSARHVNLYGNTALSASLGRHARIDVGALEVNPTCRPYHLGWILEAWSGRNDLIEAARGASA